MYKISWLAVLVFFNSCSSIKPIHYENEEVVEETIVESEHSQLCYSVQGVHIPHFDRLSEKDDPLRILVISSIHGDEPSSTIVANYWIDRLKSINPRSSWRVIPVLNPDGLKLNTRTNINKIDLNRNFPTKDFDEAALKYWQERHKSDPRRFPGDVAASEPETQCALHHLEEFKPHFVIAIHAPYGILDFDGPHGPKPYVKHLNWRRFGNFPGSLGRYLWRDQGVPVLTIELKSATEVPDNKTLDELQDVSGLLAIQTVSR